MTRAEHILATLAEEGGEVGKECHKALRFGINDKVTRDPDGPRGTEGPTNAEKIEAEMIDMLGVYQMAVTEGLVADLGFLDLPKRVVEGMMAKRGRVERYMDYARRVGALSQIPRLNEMACFAGQAEAPFRALIEGPHGFSMHAGGASPEALLASFGRSVVSTFPPHYTDDTLPQEPTPCVMIHPDYFDQCPPTVTAFKGVRNEIGLVKIQWDDGTEDWANVEDLRPVFWASLDRPAPVFEFKPMPIPPSMFQDGVDAQKERLIASLGVKIPMPADDTYAERMAKIAGSWGQPVDGVFPHAMLAKAIVPAPRGFPEGSQTQHGLDGRGWPIRTRVKGEGADWHRCGDDEIDGRKIQVIQLVASKLRGNKLGEVRMDGKTVVWASFPGVGSPIMGIAATMREAMVFVELAQAGVDFSEPGTHRRQAAESKGVAGHPTDDRRTRELEPTLAVWKFSFDAMHRPTWELHEAEDIGEGQWQPLNVLGRITQHPAILDAPTASIISFWEADPMLGEPERVKRFTDEGAEDKARAYVIAELKAYYTPQDVPTVVDTSEADEPPPKGPILAQDGDEILVEPVNGLLCLWRRRFDALNCEVWDLLVRSDVEGQEWTDQDPIIGQVMEPAFGSSWTAQTQSDDGWRKGFPSRDDAKAGVIDNLVNSPL